jgi:hypothetical protein
MNDPSVVHKDIELVQIACIKTVIEKRADISKSITSRPLSKATTSAP